MRLKSWLWATAASAVGFAALGAGLLVVDRFGEAAIARQQTTIAASARDYFVDFASEEGDRALIAAINRHERLGSSDGLRYALIDTQGHMLAGANVISSLDVPDAGWRTVVQPHIGQRRLWRALAEPLPGGLTLIIAEDLAARDGLRIAILRGAVVALALIILGAAAGGVALRAVLLRRTRDLALTAERIAAGDLSARAPTRPGGDVFDDLSGSINAMLTRIEELMTGLQTVTDSVAHDLRSPLMRARSALSRAGAPDVAEPDRLLAIDGAQAEIDGVLATLSALLDIARAETGLSREMMRKVDVTALVRELGDLFSPALEDAGQTLTLTAPSRQILVWTHETLLGQALGNLLHNAVTHAGAGAMVTMEVCEMASDAIELRVSDTGRGVPNDQLGRVQERFVRLEAARTTHGSGLGLAVVAACAKLHGGRLVLKDNAPGLRAILELPINRMAAAP